MSGRTGDGVGTDRRDSRGLKPTKVTSRVRGGESPSEESFGVEVLGPLRGTPETRRGSVVT